MSHDREKLDPVEEALLELDSVEQTRLFESTPVDGRLLLVTHAAPDWSRSRRVGLRWLSAAAGVAIAVGVWSWAFRADPVASARASISDCITGPDEVVVVTCRGYDSDADGDVDLVDFRAYQASFRGTDH